MKKQMVIVHSEHGLHARVAAQVVQAARDLDAHVSIRCRNLAKADAGSILQLLALGAEQGVEVEIEAEGTDEEEALHAVAGVFENGGGI